MGAGALFLASWSESDRFRRVNGDELAEVALGERVFGVGEGEFEEVLLLYTLREKGEFWLLLGPSGGFGVISTLRLGFLFNFVSKFCSTI